MTGVCTPLSSNQGRNFVGMAKDGPSNSRPLVLRQAGADLVWVEHHHLGLGLVGGQANAVEESNQQVEGEAAGAGLGCPSLGDRSPRLSPWL